VALRKLDVTRGTIYVAIQNAIQFSINLVSMMVLARLLSQDEIGSISALTFSFVIFVTVADFSLPTAAARFISEHLGADEPSKASEVFVAVRKYNLISSTFCFAVASLFSSFFSRVIWGTGERQLVFITLFAAAYIFVIRNVYLACLRGLHLFGRYATTVVAIIAFGRGVALYLAWTGLGVLGVMIGWLMGELLGLSLAFLF